MMNMNGEVALSFLSIWIGVSLIIINNSIIQFSTMSSDFPLSTLDVSACCAVTLSVDSELPCVRQFELISATEILLYIRSFSLCSLCSSHNHMPLINSIFAPNTRTFHTCPKPYSWFPFSLSTVHWILQITGHSTTDAEHHSLPLLL